MIVDETHLMDGALNPRLVSSIKLFQTNQPINIRPNVNRSIPKQVELLRAEGRVTSRDIQILETLYSGRPILSVDQLRRIFWTGYTHRAANKRLLKLFDYHILDRNPHSIALLGQAGMYPCISYYLGAAGRKILSSFRGELLDEENIRSYDGYLSPTMLMHDLMVSEIYTTIWEAVRDKPNTDMVWVSEHKSIIRNNQGTELVRPDGMIILNSRTGNQPNTKDTRYLFLELERHPRRDKLREKIARYENALLEGAWRDLFGLKQFPEVALIMNANMTAVEWASELIKENSKHVRWRIRLWPVSDFFDGSEWVTI